MRIVQSLIEDLVMIEPQLFGDDRGFFLESWSQTKFAGLGLDLAFVQENHSRFAKGVLRGLHFHNPNPQGKLVRVTAGSVWDTA